MLFPVTNMAIVNIIARKFDNMPMIQKWYFDGNIWRDDIDPDILVDPAMPFKILDGNCPSR